MATELNEAFEMVLNADRRLLTTRQQLWLAFEAGAQWSIENISTIPIDPPCFAEKNDGVFYQCRCANCRAASTKDGVQ